MAGQHEVLSVCVYKRQREDPPCRVKQGPGVMKASGNVTVNFRLIGHSQMDKLMSSHLETCCSVLGPSLDEPSPKLQRKVTSVPTLSRQLTATVWFCRTDGRWTSRLSLTDLWTTSGNTSEVREVRPLLRLIPALSSKLKVQITPDPIRLAGPTTSSPPEELPCRTAAECCLQRDRLSQVCCLHSPTAAAPLWERDAGGDTRGSMKHRDHRAVCRGLRDGEVEAGGGCGEGVGHADA
ncbi:hypothetical protein EYF80_030300 [Liparis tanakae]|uniref:Uncharacterized protein n=1 Tax=Liparis tanakae TaxID=230148 RepID=A0A4Z2H2G0_9TELE|nr:hypothetical protein EYF80_030300 [Liparis tanakae]